MKILSPVQAIDYKGYSLSIKRDDQIDPFISGNKWRKLLYLLEDVKATKKTHLVTFGGAYSNHVVATAAAASRNKLQSTAFIRGECVNNEMLVLCRLFGMQLIFTGREAYKDKQNLFDEHFGKNNAAYFIDEGGAGPLAAKGCAELLQELPGEFDHIFCAAGTGTTAAGLLHGIKASGRNTQLHVVPVLKGGAYLGDYIASLGKGNDFLLHTDYHFGGYAKTTPALVNFIKNFTASTGILIDPVYTGKMFYAIDELQQQGYFKKDSRILAVHTGGLLGLWGMKELF